MSTPVPYGYCHCECGGKTPLARQTDRTRQYIKGQPMRYIANHYHVGSMEDRWKRFWSKVDKAPGHGPQGRCWVWTATCYPNGYGQFSWNYGETTPAHRAAFRLLFGDIATDIFVCHKCDWRPCVRPTHLFRGNALLNNADMTQKGRRRSNTPRGERNCNAKLTEAKVLEIRAIRGVTNRAIAARYGVSWALIGQILRRKAWQHLQP